VHLENAFCDIKTDCDQIHLRAPDVGSPLLCQIKGGGSPYHQPHVDLGQPRSGHDGLFARQLPIAKSGLMPADILGFC